MKSFELMIFDLDGTLVDSASDLIAAVNYTRGVLGLTPMGAKEIIAFVGDGTDKLVERFVGPELQQRRAEALDVFLAYYEAHLLDHTALYPGVVEMLELLRDRKKIIITNKRYQLARQLTDGLGITGYFTELIGMGSTPFRKPDARIMLPLLERDGLAPAKVIIFGDGVTDIGLAKNAGAKSCALLNGFTSRETLLALDPDYFCETIGEIPALFC